MIPCGQQSNNTIEYFKQAYENKLRKYGEKWIFDVDHEKEQLDKEKRKNIRKELTKGYMALLSAQIGENR
ncbi:MULTISPECIES: hypothetical protein [Bacillus]|uniref:Uncharacterized protein n=1 Tax=Bacillus sonorensis TaxID=119858 RepID=A0ABN5AIU9_9BACI|nr:MULTISPECIES: hypothetical protein [Bacillus]ASB89325.1 hypothetical protein S101395_02818 [Bacillus sonorensis]MEC0338361.1 hypothetical protein [Bacillus sonorensis]MEC0425218.1 hypothetical protein [Bacillus sonorensis]MEC0460772.1 hypothetical protein [Bacillus sonorensis]MEC0526427.1 hypothetical protein [Bacillus sonorensis]